MGVVPARHSDDQVRMGAKRYKQNIRILGLNIGYVVLTCVRVYIMPPMLGHWFLFLGLDMRVRKNR